MSRRCRCSSMNMMAFSILSCPPPRRSPTRPLAQHHAHLVHYKSSCRLTASNDANTTAHCVCGDWPPRTHQTIRAVPSVDGDAGGQNVTSAQQALASSQRLIPRPTHAARQQRCQACTTLKGHLVCAWLTGWTEGGGHRSKDELDST